MMRAATRSFSSDYISRATAMFKYSAQEVIIPPPQFPTMPKVGLFTGGYELYHDFAIVTTN